MDRDRNYSVAGFTLELIALSSCLQIDGAALMGCFSAATRTPHWRPDLETDRCAFNMDHGKPSGRRKQKARFRYALESSPNLACRCSSTRKDSIGAFVMRECHGMINLGEVRGFLEKLVPRGLALTGNYFPGSFCTYRKPETTAAKP